MTALRTARQCFEEMQPQLRLLALALQTAPVPEGERGALALMVAAQVFGTVASALGKHPDSGVREVADLIVDIARKQRPPHLRPVGDGD